MIKSLLETIPTCSSLELTENSQLIVLDLSIKINEQKSEKIKLNFELMECTSIKEVSKYFIAGCVKMIAEQFSPVNKIILPNPALQLTEEVLKMPKDLSTMLGGKTEKDQEQEILQRKALEVRGRNKGIKSNATRHTSLIKPARMQEVKKFEFTENVSSQENDIDEEEIAQEVLPAPSTSSSASQEDKKPARKKPKKLKN